MVCETTKNETFMRSEEVYESGDTKIVTVSIPESFTWVKVKNQWYIGDGTTLYRTCPIKDLLDIATEYAKPIIWIYRKMVLTSLYGDFYT